MKNGSPIVSSVVHRSARGSPNRTEGILRLLLQNGVTGKTLFARLASYELEPPPTSRITGYPQILVVCRSVDVAPKTVVLIPRDLGAPQPKTPLFSSLGVSATSRRHHGDEMPESRDWVWSR